MQRLTADRPETQSLDGIAQNLTRLADLFPEAFTEGRLDFDVLKQLLGDQIDDRPEKYGLTWNGKARARRHALTPTRATLRPDRESSVDWDTTQNLMIEGDNLEVLKLLQRSYAGKVKLIYIDPPYNTGKDFVYPDDYTDSLRNYQELTGQTEEGRRVSSNTESSGRFHTDWLNMMYPRLKLARELLREDGMIFVNLDDRETSNLRKIMDEMYGEENFLVSFARRTKSGGGSASSHFAIEHDHVIVYAKSKNLTGDLSVSHDPEYFKRYAEEDEIGRYFWDTMERSYTKTRPYKIKAPDGTLLEGNWFRSEDRFLADLSLGEVRFLKKSEGWSVQFKQRAAQGRKLRSLLSETEYKSTHDEIDSLGMKDTFSFPKPIKLISVFAEVASNENDIILDFFAGSGTTGHAVMSQNAVDTGNRQFILVQLPEPLDSAKAEQKTAADFCDSLGVPRNIAELTKERLRRAGAKVKAENPMFAGDTGFRVFKLASSNLTGWDSEAARADLPGTLLSAEDNIKPGRTDADVLYEVLLKLGLPLTTPIEERAIAGLPVQMVGGGVLLACLARKITAAQVPELGKGMADWLEAENAAGEAHILFLDSAFENDTAKLNLSKYLTQRAEMLGRNWVVRSL